MRKFNLCQLTNLAGLLLVMTGERDTVKNDNQQLKVIRKFD